MSSVHRLEAGNDYSIEREYTDDEKRQVTPEELVRWLNLQTFGVPNPGPDDESIQPLVCANTLAFWKKAISFYMPNRLHGWRSGSKDGNPTKSAEVNDFVKRIKKLEARKQGADSKSRRPMLETEFRRLHEIFKSSTQCNHNSSTAQVWKYGMPALINFQFHLIARIDNTTQLILDHIRVHDSFDNALKTRLNWSKNVRDERDALWQVILGCMNPVFCVFISLGLWLESNLKSNPSAIASPYVFSFPTTLQCLAVVKRQKTLRRVSSDRMCLSVKSFKWQDYWGAIQFANLQQHMLENVGYPKTTRIYKVVGKARGVYQMSMTMWNFPIQIAKLQRSFVLEDRVSI
jgi:hypothetical protein